MTLIVPYFSDTNKLPIIIGVAGGGALICAAILVVAAAMLVHRRREKITLLPPDYSKYMFYPGIFLLCISVYILVTVLPTSPEEQVKIDAYRNEVLRMLDGPFEGVFALLSSLDVCESDNILKALVYTFCKQSRGDL